MKKKLMTILTLLTILNVQPGLAKSRSKSDTCNVIPTLQNSNKYKKHIENTIWVVPPHSLLAFEYEEGTHSTVSDQTVWVIDSFKKGYFFGHSYESINQTNLSQMKIMGSVTDLGDVYITFYPLDGSPESKVVTGLGKFLKKNGQYVFLMQMNSSPTNSSGLSHWAYMVSVNKESCFYQNLPGENMSLPDFLKQFEE